MVKYSILSSSIIDQGLTVHLAMSIYHRNVHSPEAHGVDLVPGEMTLTPILKRLHRTSMYIFYNLNVIYISTRHPGRLALSSGDSFGPFSWFFSALLPRLWYCSESRGGLV